TDISIQVDNRLHSGIARVSPHRTRDYLKNAWSIYKAKRDLRQRNPVSQLRSAMRQKEQSDTGKVLVMLHHLEQEGYYVAAIGFMGTGKRFYDWFSNFRMTSDGGFHKGFLQLARQFEENEAQILFPQTAQELGVEKLSLRDILEECRRPDSRFRIWMAGHSQGGAVMQMWTHLKIHEDGVLPAHLTGYGFASPTVASSTVLADPAAYPLYHVINSDDLVPRMGARIHMGMGLSYPSGPRIRENCYGWSMGPEAVTNRALMRRITRRMVDAPSCLESALAFVELMAEQPTERLDDTLATLQARFNAVKRLLLAADRREEDLIRFIKRHAAYAYRSMTGKPMDMALVARLKADMEAVEAQIGFNEMSRSLQELMTWSHALVGKGGRAGPYRYIVNEGVGMLEPFIWQSGAEPMRLWLEKTEEAPARSLPPEGVALWNKHLPKARRRQPPRRHHGYLSRRR
ncbi:MAG: hypothetical protein IJ461_07595, partial [Clostridia bacterium]|nr:hypothetical protein [Clostridia bacterium]